MRTPTGLVGTALIAICAACAVGRGSGTKGAGLEARAASFTAGERVTHSDGIVLELSEAEYHPQMLKLRLRLDNRGPAEATIERASILLAYEGLEYPLAQDLTIGLEGETLSLGAGESVELGLGFRMGHALTEAARLHLYSVRLSETEWAAPLRIVIPPPAA